MKMRSFSLLLIVALITGCASNKIGYFTIYTSVEYTGPKISAPLHVVLENNIQNKFVLSKNFLGDNYRVSQFRKTVKNNLVNTLKKSFDSVSVSDELSTKGLSLVVREVNAQPYLAGTYPDSSDSSDRCKWDVPCKVFTRYAYNFSLMKNGNELQNWHWAILSRYFVSNVGLYPGTFKYGLRAMCQDISNKILSGNTLASLRTNTR